MKQLRQFVLVVASIVWVVSAVAADAPKSRSSQDAFEVSIYVTSKGEELFNNWDRPTGKPFNVESLKVAPRGKFLSTVVFFKGCKPDRSGNCNAVVDIVAYDPKGKLYGQMPGVELWQKKPAPDPGYTQLSRSYMGLVIEPNDPPGIYRITAVARDLNGKSEANSEASFEVK